jgi:hypothetical protein
MHPSPSIQGVKANTSSLCTDIVLPQLVLALIVELCTEPEEIVGEACVKGVAHSPCTTVRGSETYTV